MQGFGVVPVEHLRGGGMVIAEGAAEAFRTDTQIERAAEDGQMAQQTRLIETMWLSDEPSAAPAPRAGQGALDGQDELTRSGEIGLKDAHILDIERDGDKWLTGHGAPSFVSASQHRPMFSQARRSCNPY